MLIDASLLALKEKADAGDLDAQIKMCRVYQVGSGAPVDYQKAIHYTLLILSHDPETMEKNGEEYDILLWAIGRFYADIHKHFDALLCFQKNMKYIQETYVPDSAERLIQAYELREYMAKIVPQATACMWLNGTEVMRYIPKTN